MLKRCEDKGDNTAERYSSNIRHRTPTFKFLKGATGKVQLCFYFKFALSVSMSSYIRNLRFIPEIV